MNNKPVKSNNRDIILIKRGCPYCEKILDNDDFKNSRKYYKVIEINSLGDKAKEMIDKYSIMYIPTMITTSNEILEGYDDVMDHIKENNATKNIRYINKLNVNDDESSDDKFSWKHFMFLPDFQ